MASQRVNALVLPEVNTVHSSAEQLRGKFPTVFHGVGKLKGFQARLHVDVEVLPVAQRQHREPESNIADSLSRLLDADQQCPETHRDDEEAVRLIAQAAAPIAIGVQEVERESATDPELSVVHSCIWNGNLDQLPAAYKNMRFELMTLGRLVLRGQHIVIPQALRQRTVSLAHEGHQGIVKTKERLRIKV